MEQLLPESWVYMHFVLILVLTGAQMLVIYILGDSSDPPAGLGMYTVYFMASLLGWIAFTLQHGSGQSMTVDVSSVAVILNTYILFLAAGQRSKISRGRYLLGAICLASSLCGLVLPPLQMFVIQITASTLFFLAAGILCAWRSYRENNMGDGIIAFAAIIMCASLPFAVYQLVAADNIALAQAIAFGSYSCAYVLVAIGFLASVLIEYQGNLARLATHDPLSRVFNRRGMDEALQLSLAFAQRRELPVSAIMIDIDHLNQINTSFGPDIGDQVIKTIADILQNLSRASDVVARIDAEKFLLILPETELVSAKTLADRICTAIGERPLLVEQQRIAVTVSIGVTGSKGDVNLDRLSREAGKAMQLAKQAGRNQVASIDPQPVRLTTDSTGA
jgi:diguanylate cyclase (GGDEF)-like protein